MTEREANEAMQELHDDHCREAHEAYVRWLRHNPHGCVLNVMSGTEVPGRGVLQSPCAASCMAPLVWPGPSPIGVASCLCSRVVSGYVHELARR